MNQPGKRRLLLNWSLLLASLLALAGAAYLYHRYLTRSQEAEKKGGRSFKITVDTAPVVRDTLRPTLRVQGDVVSRHAATIRAEVDGVVTEVPVREGQEVKADALLLRLEERDRRLALRRTQALALQAASAVKRQEAALAKARDLERRLVKLDKDALVSREEVENARLAVQSAEAALAEARAQAALRHVEVLTARRDLSRSSVRAPFSGKISARHVETGDRVSVGTPVIKLVGGAGVELRLYLPSSQVSHVTPGTPVRYRLAGREGEWRSAEVTRVLPTADPGSRNQTVVVALEDPPRSITAGMAVEAEMAVDQIPRALVVSGDALTRHGNQWVVFKVVEGKAQRVIVQRLGQAGQRVAISGPLDVGEPVVVLGNESLFANAPVRVVGSGKHAPRETDGPRRAMQRPEARPARSAARGAAAAAPSGSSR